MSTTLPGSIKAIPAGTSVADVNQQLSGSQAKVFKDNNIEGIIRYIPRTGALAAGNATAPEISAILGQGVAVGFVQHVSPDDWFPTYDLGSQYGSFAAYYLEKVVGVPKGVTVWLDLEMVNKSAKAEDIIAYCNEWWEQVNGAGYSPGIYIGWQTGLSDTQLWSLKFQRYWRGYNCDQQIPTRGYCMSQHPQKVLDGITYDPSTSNIDALGGSTLWLSL